jgi:hypothetical protein
MPDRKAPKKDQIKGSDKNKSGSSASQKAARMIKFSDAVETSLRNKVEAHNEKASKGRKTSLATLKAVYRRGAGAYSTSHRPGKTRNQWAMARVNAFLKLLKAGKPENSAYVSDNDLLPASHPKSTKKSLTAGGGILVPEERELADALLEIAETYGKFNEDGTGIYAGYRPAADNPVANIGVMCANCVLYRGGDQCAIVSMPVEPAGKCRFAVIPDGVVKPEVDTIEEIEILPELLVIIKAQEEYDSPEDAILDMVEYSGLGYEAEPALRAAWIRATNDGTNPFDRTLSVAELGYNSQDADLLPRVEKGTHQ